MAEKATKANLAEFLSRKPYSVIHIDAKWDGYQKVVADRVDSLESELRQDVSFGSIDSDTEQEYVREIGIVNVPSVAYYRGDRLVASIVGVRQDIAENIKRLQQGEQLETANRQSRD
jgi:thioredoxin-like negative regulator of GroEL